MLMGILSFRMQAWSCSLCSFTGIVSGYSSVTNSSLFFPELGLSDWHERRKCSDVRADAIAFLCVGPSVISFISTRNILISCNSMSWWKSDKLVIVLRVHECIQDLTRAEYPLLNWIHSNTTKRKALWKCWLSITLHGGMLSSGSQGLDHAIFLY